jgi:hypothetical protein
MTPTYNACTTKFVTTSGTGVIGITGKPIYLQGILNAQASAQAIALYSGSAAVTMVFCTLPARSYTAFPAAGPNGITYQTASNPGDADLRLVFFWVPGSTT